MKTAVIRAFVVALALSGAFAVSHAAPVEKATLAPAHPQSLPVPSCDPNDPSCTLGG